ncbi:hypothetical protein [Metapseudomonas otitidis]|nr:hypothetical protein [Pseudomonas otitidis]
MGRLETFGRLLYSSGLLICGAYIVYYVFAALFCFKPDICG